MTAFWMLLPMWKIGMYDSHGMQGECTSSLHNNLATAAPYTCLGDTHTAHDIACDYTDRQSMMLC